MAQGSGSVELLLSGVLGTDVCVLHQFCQRKESRCCFSCFNCLSSTMRSCCCLPRRREKKLGRKRIACLVAFSLLFLSAAITALSLGIPLSRKRKFHNGGASWAGSSKAIDSACNKTLYPELCVSTLLSYPNAERESPKNFAHITVNVTMGRIQEAYSVALKVAPQGMESTEKMAVEDCMELLQDSIYHLNHSQAEIARLGIDPSNAQIVDIQTWLSAALTNQETCLDGLQESGINANTPLQERSYDLAKSISNALAMVQISFPKNSLETNMFHVSHPLQHSRRPLLEQGKEISEPLDEEFPEWMSVADWRLLRMQDSGVLLANVTVAQDGTGHFKTITEAVNNAPSYSRERYIIFVRQGIYNENVVVSKKKINVMLIGEGRTKTIVASHRNVKDGCTTFRSATFAATGRGFIARDMTFANSAGPSKYQAVALRVGADYSAIYRCNIFGYQDTLYVHSLRQFYRECNIYGTVDFIFGNAAVVLQNCNIIVRRPMRNQKNTITAQGRQDPYQNTGICIQNCRVVAGRDLTPVKNSFPTYLGRPWKMHSRTVFMKTFLDDLIHPAGWLEWSEDFALESLHYREYMNTGPGANVNNRVKWGGYSVIKTAEEANNFTVDNLISGSKWLPSTGISFNGGLA
ncbi:hypothetical protein SUGI_0287040 [Cryptomeria japonica]|uniref:pectinesterase n=1 Tax=Cryptomeria japonica TaxID=3369 RepID=UPI002408EF34|nr:pectinesterase [Cryptomeria japonica]GLJ16709.1 hypothetical protein SUGI_0287040 [Cryptomeria japonica]